MQEWHEVQQVTEWLDVCVEEFREDQTEFISKGYVTMSGALGNFLQKSNGLDFHGAARRPQPHPLSGSSSPPRT